MRVSEISKEKVASVPRDCPIVECAKIMAQEHIGDLVITEPGEGGLRPIGIITDRDIVVKLVAAGINATVATAFDLMGTELLTARQDDELDDVLKMMKRHGINRIPVLDRKGNLAGIMTASDILKALAGELGSLAGMSEGQHLREEHALKQESRLRNAAH